MSGRPIRHLLLVEDNPGDARLLREMLSEQSSQGIGLTHVECMSFAENHLAEHAVDVILLDLGLPDTRGLEGVRRAHAAAPRVPLVVLTGNDDESLATLALQEGAQDYLVKGQIETRGLLRALRYAVERKNMEEALYLEKERAQVTLNCIGDAVVCTDTAGKITFLNVVAEVMTGWLWNEAAGRDLEDVFRIRDTESQDVHDPETATFVNRTGRGIAKGVLIRRDGFEIPIEDCVAPIHDREGHSIGSVVVFRDVRASRALTLAMIHSAEHDFLTGLPNRMLLSDRINQAIAHAQRHKKHIAALFLDLDGFKKINDSLGHAMGDKLLQSVAARLVSCVRGSDTVSRQGGDEFVVLLSEATLRDDAAITAKRMLEEVAKVHSIEEHDLHVTTSIGVSVYPDDGIDAETLIKNADTAMYQAKQRGRQNFQFYRPEMSILTDLHQPAEQSSRAARERRQPAPETRVSR